MDKPQRKWLVRHAGDHGIYDNTDDELFDVVERGEGWLISIATNLDRDTARLIAAAPDLYAALVEGLRFIEDWMNARGYPEHVEDWCDMHGEADRFGPTEPDSVYAKRDRLRAALSKALGRTVTK
jgi:hypothetical protein